MGAPPPRHRASLPSLSFSLPALLPPLGGSPFPAMLPALRTMCPHRLAALMGMLAAEAAADEDAAAAAAAGGGGPPRLEAAPRLLAQAAAAAAPARPSLPPPPPVDWEWVGLCALSGAGFLALAAAVRRVVAGGGGADADADADAATSPSLLEPLAPGEVCGANPAFVGAAGKV